MPELMEGEKGGEITILPRMRITLGLTPYPLGTPLPTPPARSSTMNTIHCYLDYRTIPNGFNPLY